jgi:purine-cytosine permease-like protein
VRISRGRLLLRAVLLVLGGGYMGWRAWETRQAAQTLTGAERVLGERLALVMGLVGLLALLIAILVTWQLRSRERRHSLHLPAPTPPAPRSDDP